MKTLILASMIGFAAMAATPGLAADGAKTPARQCFMTREIRNHTVGDRNTLYLNVGGRDTWRVTMSNNCLSASTGYDPLVIRNFTGSTDICRPLDLDIGVNTGDFTSHCIVSGISKMSPAEVAALPAKVRP
jgi:hypothetical protein